MEINSDESKVIENSESINTQPKLINNSEWLSFLSQSEIKYLHINLL